MRNLKDTSGLEQIRRDMEYFCLTAGQRLAGSPGEEKAARYTARRFEELGLGNVAILPFSCKQWLPGRGEMYVLGGPTRPIACQTCAHSPSTPDEGVEGELVIFEPVDWERGLRRSDLAGKVGLFHGGYGESAEVFQELHDSALEALIFVDTRLQTDWPIANGMGEKFMRLARKPMAYISLMDAWDLARNGVKRVRIRATGEAVAATSWNVVGELPGSDSSGRVIVVGGHLDSVALGCGADDDASGVAAVLECARRLRTRPCRHTLRFIGFGAEEQLSVGSTRYVEQQAEDLDRVGFVCNLDSVAAWLGLSTVMTTGTPKLDDYVREIVEEKQAFGVVRPDASPYQDHFPFAARGIPGVWFSRKTHIGGNWYHHSPHNDLDVCCMQQIAWAAETACELLSDLAAKERWPFPRRISPSLRGEIEQYRRELFD